MYDKFEKEVQKKMEELNLTPSAPVWEKIELEIRPEKKRRRPIFWLFFGLLFVGGGFLTYELLQPAKQLTSKVAVPKTSINTTTQTAPGPQRQNTIPITVGKEKVVVPKSIDIPVDYTSSTINTKEIVSNERKTTRPDTKKIDDPNTILIELKKNKLSVTLEQPIKNPTTSDRENRIDVQAKTTKEPAQEMPKDNASITVDTVAKTLSAIVIDSVVQPQETKQVPPISTDTVAKKKVAANSKWKKEVNVSVGKSGYGSISIFKGYAMNDVFASPSPISSGSNAIVRRPSDVKNGLAYSVGFAVARKLNEHFEVAFGLQYTQYSTTINVGNNRRNDTIIQSSAGSFRADQYYTNTNATNHYTNRFHALEIPVTVSYKPVLKLPVLLSVGAAYGQLLSTNALTYSSTANLYYEDDDNYVRHMLPLFSAIEVELFAKKKTSFRIGPFIQYNLLKIKKENTGNSSHLVFAGIKSAIIF